ncbi:Acg family FMN-binding oxidoreductase [Nocardia takedensis]
MSDGEPLPGPDRAAVSAALRLAGRAPSVHNTQPWRWVLRGDELQLLRDDRYLLEVADPAGRQLVISCGAVLHHARTAFAAAGWHTDTELFPDHDTRDLLARVRFRPWPDPPHEVLARAQAITRRHTERSPMSEPQHWDRLLPTLTQPARRHDVDVDVLDDSARPRLAVASEQAAAIQRYDMGYQSELRWWTGHSRPGEGIAPDSLPTQTDAANTPIKRPFPTAEHASGPDIEDRSRLVALSTAGDTPVNWMQTGAVLSALLLQCTVEDTATCALTHLTELPAARHVVAGLIEGHRTPQVLIRIGTVPATRDSDRTLTPRRPIEDYLTIEAG